MKETNCQPSIKKMLWLPQLRNELGYSQPEMAAELGIEVSTLRKYEYGVHVAKFSPAQIKVLARLLKKVKRNITHLPDDGLSELTPIRLDKTEVDREKIAA